MPAMFSHNYVMYCSVGGGGGGGCSGCSGWISAIPCLAAHVHHAYLLSLRRLMGGRCHAYLLIFHFQLPCLVDFSLWVTLTGRFLSLNKLFYLISHSQ